MIYFDDMTSKHGFDDGENIPRQAYSCRSLYITTLNHIASKRGSNLRTVAWDRPGMHNHCMLAIIDLDVYIRLGYDTPEGDPTTSNPLLNDHDIDISYRVDEGFDEAMEIAHELYLDEYITSMGHLKKNAQVMLKELMAVALSEYDA